MRPYVVGLTWSGVQACTLHSTMSFVHWIRLSQGESNKAKLLVINEDMWEVIAPDAYKKKNYSKDYTIPKFWSAGTWKTF
jgi:hypothetical protein